MSRISSYANHYYQVKRRIRKNSDLENCINFSYPGTTVIELECGIDWLSTVGSAETRTRSSDEKILKV